MIEQDISEKQAKSIYLGIGSNLGNKKRNIEKAKYKLIQKNIIILQSSYFYESPSWPDPAKPNFLNIVVEVSTNLNAKDLLKICSLIEAELGRKKTFRNAPRICDIDVLDYKSEVSKKGIVLPHPRMHSRNFVLLPLFELNKNWFHPILKQHIKTLISMLSNKDITSIKQI